MLWNANRLSIEARYPDTVGPDFAKRAPGVVGEDYLYKYEWHDYKWDPIQVYASCDCLEYQACEYDEWEGSEAHAFLEALRRQAIHSMPEYERAGWSVPEPTGLQRLIG